MINLQCISILYLHYVFIYIHIHISYYILMTSYMFLFPMPNGDPPLPISGCYSWTVSSSWPASWKCDLTWVNHGNCLNQWEIYGTYMGNRSKGWDYDAKEVNIWLGMERNVLMSAADFCCLIRGWVIDTFLLCFELTWLKKIYGYTPGLVLAPSLWMCGPLWAHFLVWRGSQFPEGNTYWNSFWPENNTSRRAPKIPNGQ